MLTPYRELMQVSTTLDQKVASLCLNPICIAGVGGSGTRLLATLFQKMGYSLGDYLADHSLDNLYWPPIRHLLTSEPTKYNNRTVLLSQAFAIFEQLMTEARNIEKKENKPWVSKVPGSFLFIEELSAFFPKVKFILLVRNGLDMCFSSNINQLNTWGFYFDLYPEPMFSPDRKFEKHDILEYWIRANNYTVSLGNQLLGDNFLVLSYDDLCLSPEPTLTKLFNFVNQPLTSEHLQHLSSLISPPKSIGRFRKHDYQSLFKPEQLEAVKSLGFDI